MKKLLILILLAFTITANAQQISGTQITSSIVPNDIQDNYPTHVDSLGFGGYRVVPTIAARNNIKSSRKVVGMLVYVTADDKIYKLETLPNTWIEYSSGSGASQWQDITGGIEYPSGNVTVNDTLIVNGNIIAEKNIYSDTTFANVFKENYLTLEQDTDLYVSELGSDITGNGTELNPYKTFNKVLLKFKDLNNKNIFIYVDTGTYVIDNQTVDIINNYHLNGTLIRIYGSQVYDTLEKNLTLTAISGDDKFQYATTGTFWTNDLYNKKHVRNTTSSKIYPISDTKLDTLEFVDWDASGIYDVIKLQTNFINQSGKGIKLKLKYAIAFYYCNVDLTVGDNEYRYNYFYDNRILFYYSNLTAGTITGKEYITAGNDANMLVLNSSTTAKGIRNQTGNSQFSIYGTYVHGDISAVNSTELKLRDAIIDEGELQVSLNALAHLDLLVTDAIKIKNNTQAFRMYSGTFLQNGKKIIIENISEFVEMETTSNVNFYVEDIIGEPSSVWYDWDVTATKHRYYPEKGLNLGIKGVDYREMDSQISTTLVNSSTTEITIGNKTQNRSINIDYTAYRNGKIEQGTVQIFHDGTTLFINKTSHDNQSGNGIGLSINAKFDTGDTDLINLELIVDDNVDNITFDYSITRKMI